MKLIKAQITSQNNWAIIDGQLERYFLNKLTSYTLVSFCEMFFYKTPRVLTEKWLGILHDPPNTDEFIPDRNIFNSDEFVESLKTCRLLFCMSDELAAYVKTKTDTPVVTLYHPASTRPIRAFDMNKFSSNPSIVQIGNWLRRPYAIFILDTVFEKKILPYNGRLKREVKAFMKRDRVSLGWRQIFSIPKAAKVQAIKRMCDDDYCGLFENHIVYLNLYASTANNVILECINGATPILINRLSAIEKYLGENYPMFYTSDSDIASLLSMDNIQHTHEYLKNRSFDFLAIDKIMSAIERTIIECEAA